MHHRKIHQLTSEADLSLFSTARRLPTFFEAIRLPSDLVPGASFLKYCKVLSTFVLGRGNGLSGFPPVMVEVPGKAVSRSCLKTENGLL